MKKVALSKQAWAYVVLISVVLIWSLSPIVSNVKLVKNNYSPGMIITLRSTFATIALAIIAGVLYGVNIAVTGVFTKKLDSGLYVFIQLAIQAVAAFGYSMIEKKYLWRMKTCLHSPFSRCLF